MVAHYCNRITWQADQEFEACLSHMCQRGVGVGGRRKTRGRETDRHTETELPEPPLNSRWCAPSEVQPLPAGTSLLARLGTGSSPFCLSVKRMGFLLTLEYCERAGRGQASPSLSPRHPLYLFCARLFGFWGCFQLVLLEGGLSSP